MYLGYYKWQNSEVCGKKCTDFRLRSEIVLLGAMLMSVGGNTRIVSELPFLGRLDSRRPMESSMSWPVFQLMTASKNYDLEKLASGRMGSTGSSMAGREERKRAEGILKNLLEMLKREKSQRIDSVNPFDLPDL